MARIITLFFILMMFISPVTADTTTNNNQNLSLSTLVTLQNVPFEQCTKIFDIDTENLYYLTIASINANRFNITELQSKTGYILFNAVGKEFLASVIKVDDTHSLLRITPTNNIYYFQPGIVLNVFKYVEINKNLRPVNLKIN